MTMTQIRTVKMYKNKMLNTLLILLAMGFGFAVQAGPVDYYEPHLTLSSPIGTIDYGRSLHKGGWAYGYDLFNKPFDTNLLRLKLTKQPPIKQVVLLLKQNFLPMAKALLSELCYSVASLQCSGKANIINLVICNVEIANLPHSICPQKIICI